MKTYEILFTELDRCEFTIDYEYTGELEDYTYNGITYNQSSEFYFNHLKKLYTDFLSEWTTLSEEDRKIAHNRIQLLFDNRFISDDFFFDVPDIETVEAMKNDRYVPKKDIEMAFFLYKMSSQQKFFLRKVTDFFNLTTPSSNTQTDTSENSLTKPQEHTYNFNKKAIDKIEELYDRCIEFDELGITKSRFVTMFENADFSETLKENGNGRQVVYFVTYFFKHNILDEKLGEEWFAKVCSSLKKTTTKVRSKAYDSKYWGTVR